MDRRMYRSEVEETTISVRYQLDHLTMRLYKVQLIVSTGLFNTYCVPIDTDF